MGKTRFRPLPYHGMAHDLGQAISTPGVKWGNADTKHLKQMLRLIIKHQKILNKNLEKKWTSL